MKLKICVICRWNDGMWSRLIQWKKYFFCVKLHCLLPATWIVGQSSEPSTQRAGTYSTLDIHRHCDGWKDERDCMVWKWVSVWVNISLNHSAAPSYQSQDLWEGLDQQYWALITNTAVFHLIATAPATVSQGTANLQGINHVTKSTLTQ